MNDDTWSVTWAANTNEVKVTEVGDSTFYFDSTGTALIGGDKLNVTWQVDMLEPTLHACLVCDEKQEHQICKVCVLAVTQYRDELFLKQIKELL